MTLTADAVFITPDVDHTALTADRFPHSPGQLPCGGCGETRNDHAEAERAGECRTFVRPALPDGFAYADTITRGMHIRRLRRPGQGSERVLGLSLGGDPRTERMLLSRSSLRDFDKMPRS